MTVQHSTDPYDQLFFESKPSPERHIIRHATLAALFGLLPPPLKNATVLEIGCSTGSNLIPQALAFPEARFTGIDRSTAQIGTGKELIKKLKLSNITLNVADIMDFPHEEASFDYIICHGLYSWVTHDVQQKILAVCAKALRRNGIAYISYNLLPGWRMRETIRNYVRQFDDGTSALAKRVAAARTTMQQLHDHMVDAHTHYALELRHEVGQCLKQSDSFIAHELLAEICTPFYLRDFGKDLGETGLKYFADALPTRMRSLRAEAGEAQLLKNLSAVEKEQYFDLLSPLSFRGSLLCRAEQTPKATISAEIISQLWITSPLVPLNERPDIHGDDNESFCGPSEQTIEVAEPLLKSALIYLRNRWPEPVSFKELIDAAIGLAGQNVSVEQAKSALSEFLLRYFFVNLVELYHTPYVCSREVPTRLRTSAFIAHQSLSQNWITTLRHEFCTANELERRLLPLLDGTHTREELIEKMVRLLDSGNLTLKESGAIIVDRKTQTEVMAEKVDACLAQFAEAALLLPVDGR